MGYAENMYQWLKRNGYADKYDHAGIYCIKIDNIIVYIGKSTNMLRRVAEHYAAIKGQETRKYRILAEAQRKGHSINFDVLYDAKARYASAIKEEIGEKEGEYIRANLPILNSQIPKAEDWHKYEINEIAKTITLSEILELQKKSIQMEQFSNIHEENTSKNLQKETDS